MLRAGDEIGPYTLVSRLGRGAFGVVWLAERRTTITTTTVALKIPLDDEIDLETIRQEANLWVRASGHPNVLPIIEANVYDEYVVIASEYAPDGPLDGWLNQYAGNSLSFEAAIEIITGILSGLEHLHARNIIHRDLKPANILFQGTTPRLADFGISRVLKSTSQSSIVAGTPSYMAPEAFDGKRNERTDIWSVGVIFYQMLAGRLPFPQTDITSLMGAILTRNPDPLPLSIPAPLQEVIARSLSKNIQERYASAIEMRASLRNLSQASRTYKPETAQSFSSPQPTAITHRPPMSPQSEPRRSNRTYYVIAGLICALVLAFGILAIIMLGTKSASLTNSSAPIQNNTAQNKGTAREIVEFDIPLGSTVNDFTYTSSGDLLYQQKPFSPKVSVSPNDVSAFKISFLKSRNMSAAISIDGDGHNKLFLLDMSNYSSTAMQEPDMASAAQKVFWSPSQKYMVALCSYEGERFIGINLSTKRLTEGDFLGPSDKMWRISNDPYWLENTDVLVFNVTEHCNPYDDANCNSSKVLAAYEIRLDPASIKYSSKRTDRR